MEDGLRHGVGRKLFEGGHGLPVGRHRQGDTGGEFVDDGLDDLVGPVGGVGGVGQVAEADAVDLGEHHLVGHVVVDALVPGVHHGEDAEVVLRSAPEVPAQMRPVLGAFGTIREGGFGDEPVPVVGGEDVLVGSIPCQRKANGFDVGCAGRGGQGPVMA